MPFQIRNPKSEILLPYALCSMLYALCRLPLDSRFALHEIEAEISPETDSK